MDDSRPPEQPSTSRRMSARYERLWAYLGSHKDSVAELVHDLPIRLFLQPSGGSDNWRAIPSHSSAVAGARTRAGKTCPPGETQPGILPVSWRPPNATAGMSIHCGRPLSVCRKNLPPAAGRRRWTVSFCSWRLPNATAGTSIRCGRCSNAYLEKLEPAHAWETQPGRLPRPFLETAKRHGRDVDPLWQAIEREPEKFAARARETPLDSLVSFLETAKRHGRNVDPLWQVLEREPENVAARAWETPLDHLASFLETAKRHGRDVNPLWQAIECEPEKVAARAWETPLDHLASFLETAKRHGRDVDPLWQAIEREPEKLAARPGRRRWATSPVSWRPPNATAGMSIRCGRPLSASRKNSPPRLGDAAGPPRFVPGDRQTPRPGRRSAVAGH